MKLLAQKFLYFAKHLKPSISSLAIATFLVLSVSLLIIKTTGISIATGTDNVLTMGRNESGQLGYGTQDYNAHGTPTLITNFGNVIAASAATSASYAVKSDGTIWAWGDNSLGELGDNTTTNRYSPIQVLGAGGNGYLTNIKAVSALDYHTLALANDGTVWSWGSNSQGQLGNGTTTDSHTPIQVISLSNVIAIATAGDASLALKSDGTVWAWGGNGNGDLGNGSSARATTPIQVVGLGGSGYLTNVIAISGGENFFLALKSDGTVWAWGQNGNGELGDGISTDSSTPVEVVGTTGTGNLSGVTAISAGLYHSLALKSDGTVWAWGFGHYGDLGVGNTNDSLFPIQVKDSTGNSYLTNVTNISSGGERSFAQTQDTKVWGWGEDNLGALGNGTTGTSYSLPTESTGLKGVSEISTGVNHSIAFNPISPTPSLVLAINAGGSTQGNFVADTDSSGGQPYSSTASVDTSSVTNPAPQSVYQSVRYGNNFTYTIPNLTANANYTVRLHFNELYWHSAGSRVFNVAINGTNVLTNFDIFQTAGGANIANVQQFPTTADANGNISIQFTTDTDNAMVNGIELWSGTLPSPTVTPTPSPASSISINAGAGATGSFLSDENYSGGQSYTSTASVDTTNVTNPAPQSVYQSVRYGNFTYTVPNLFPSTTYTVKLHFNELYWGTSLSGNQGGVGSRVFNVAINGQQVLSNYDIFQDAGGANKAVIKSFTTTSDTNGKLTIVFTSVTDNATVNGIEISQ